MTSSRKNQSDLLLILCVSLVLNEPLSSTQLGILDEAALDILSKAHASIALLSYYKDANR